MKTSISVQTITSKIYAIRGLSLMLDTDLAKLYEIPAKQLNRQVRRNRERFPADFMITLTPKEYEFLRCQIGTLETTGSGKHRKYLPFAFTEQGVAMLSSVLKSKKAIWMNIQIMRAFVQMKQTALTHKELTLKLSELEKKVGKHGEDIQTIIAAIQQLLIHEEKPKRRMGF